VKALFAQYGGFVLPPLNNMEVLAHISNGRIEDVAMETLNLSMKENLLRHFKWKGLKSSPPLQTTHRVLTDPEITTF
jgi:hypothetical protein